MGRGWAAVREVLGLVLAALGVLLAGPAARAGQLAPAIDEQVWRAPVAPGVDFLAVRRLDADGWLDLFALLVDLSVPGVDLQALTPGALTARRPTSELVREAGAAGGINGDFFYLGATESPVGLLVRGGTLWKGPDPFGRPTLAVLEGPGGLRAQIGVWRLHARAVAPDGTTLALDGWNESSVRPGQVVGFDEHWGPAPLPLTRAWAQELAYTRLHLADPSSGSWVVSAAGSGPTAAPASGERVLLGWREGARRLLEVARPGQRLALELELVAADGSVAEGLRTAISGGGWLLRGGQAVAPAPVAGQPPGDVAALHPRAAAGVDTTGRRLVLAVADGRRATSRGLTIDQLAAWMRRLGAWDALYLDGGGSATLVADLSGDGPTVINRPSAGQERPVPVALGVFYHPPGGPMAPFVLRPAWGPPAPDPEGYAFGFAGVVTAPGIPTRVEAFPRDAQDGLAWSVDPPDLGYFAGPGRFVGLREGEGMLLAARVSADSPWRQTWPAPPDGLHPPGPSGDPVAETAAGRPQRWAAVASVPVRVIGEPVSLEIHPPALELAEGSSAPVRVRVRDRLGRFAPVDPDQVAVWLRGPATARWEGGRLRLERVWQDGPLFLEARYLHLQARVPVQVAGGPAPAAAAAPDGPGHSTPGAAPPAGQPPTPTAHTGSRPPATPPAPADSEPPLRVLLLADAQLPWDASEPADLTVVLASDHHALQAITAGQPARRQPVLTVRLGSGGGPGLAAFVQRFGWPNAVATRGSTRFVAVDPSLAPWRWLQEELHRARAEGLRRLVLVSARPPQRWPLPREGAMVQAWLSRAAERGLEVWWLHGHPDLRQPAYWQEERVHHLAVPWPGAGQAAGEDPVPLWWLAGPSGVELRWGQAAEGRTLLLAGRRP